MTRLTYLNLYTDLILLTSQIEDIALKKVTVGRRKKETRGGKKEKSTLKVEKEMETKREKEKSTMKVEKEQEREDGGKKRAPP